MTRTLRIPILVLLPLLLVAGLVVESSSDDAAPTDVRVGELTPTASAAGTLSSTWYCAAGSATGVASGEGAGPAEQRVIVANASDAASTGTMTLYPEGGAPTVVPVEVPAHGRAEVVVSEHVVAPWAAALVEVTGGEVTVAHALSGPTGRSLSDCASAPSSGWYFPGGTTAVGTEMWLTLFNPFPGEATIDVAFDTTDGARTPQDYQGIVVPGGSVVVKKVSDVVTLDPQISTTVSARSGRVVAEQVQAFEGRDGGVKGLTATIGATSPSPIWTFPTTAPLDVSGTETVAVFNPGDTDTEVQVQVQLEDPAANGTVEPFEISVPARRFAVVAVSDDARVPAGVPHWVIVRSADGSDIVAQRSLSSSAGGYSTVIGMPVVSTRWLAPAATSGDATTSLLSVANPSPTQTATVSVRRQGGGAATAVPEATEIQVAPGERLAVDLLAAEFTSADSVEVVSDIPVVVGQWLTFPDPSDIATPLGIPVAGSQEVPDAVVGPGVAGEDQLSTDSLVQTDTLVDPDAPPTDGSTDTTSAAGTDGSAADGSSTTTSTTAAG